MIEITRNSIQLWAIELVPALLPYMIMATFTLEFSHLYISINNNKIINYINNYLPLSMTAIFILFTSHLCGYPIGAKLIAESYKNKTLSKEESNYLLSICNQASPAFLLFYVGKYILNETLPSWSIYIIFYGSTIMTAILMKHIYLKSPKTLKKYIPNSIQNKRSSIITLLDDSIYQSCLTILKVGGYIIVFSLITHYLRLMIPTALTPLHILISTIEISTGLIFIQTTQISNYLYVPLINTIAGFGGFCTMAQIKGMLIRTSLSLKPYIIGKIIYMLIVFIVSLLFV